MNSTVLKLFVSVRTVLEYCTHCGINHATGRLAFRIITVIICIRDGRGVRKKKKRNIIISTSIR